MQFWIYFDTQVKLLLILQFVMNAILSSYRSLSALPALDTNTW